MKKNKTVVISALLALLVLFTCALSSCGYKTLAEYINSSAFQKAMGDAVVEGMKISYEAEGDYTIKVNYDLEQTISDDMLETARASYNETLADKDTISSLQEMYDAIHRLFPSEDVKIHVVFKDANGTLIAEKTYGAADFE